MKILIVRHGDPDYENDTLTKKGWREAELLADRLSTLEVKEFYVSPLGRARDTLAPTLKRIGREAVVLPWAEEFFRARIARPDRPERSSICWDWLPQDWTKEPNFYDRGRWPEHPVLAESTVASEYRKVCDGLDAWLSQHGYVREGNYYRVEEANRDCLVLVCHFGVESVILSHLMNVSPMVLWHGTCALPTSVTTIYTEERRKGIASFRMTSYGDLSHLYIAGEEPSFAARFCETYDNFEERHD